MKKRHTKVFMDSGIEYLFEMSQEEFIKHVTDTDGKIHNRFIRLSTKKQDVAINPVHISSLEEIEVNTLQKIGIL